MKLSVSEGSLEQLIRIVAGIVLLNVAAVDLVGGPLFYLVLAAGAISLATGLTATTRRTHSGGHSGRPGVSRAMPSAGSDAAVGTLLHPW